MRSGSVFALERAKTGRAAAGTLSRWSEAILDAYLKKLGVELHASAPIFWTRGGMSTTKGGRPWPPRPYSADRLGIDFRHVRSWCSGRMTSAKSRTCGARVPSRQCAARGSNQAVGQDGQHDRVVEPIAPDLYPGRRCRCARCRRGARRAGDARTKPEQKVATTLGQKVATEGTGTH